MNVHRALLQVVPLTLAAALMLLGCGNTPQSLAEPCAVVEGRRGAVDTGVTRYVLAEEQPNAFCDNDLVRQHYNEARDWFRTQTASGEYPPSILDDLALYYAEPLLHEARTTIAYHQQAGRVAAPRWNEENQDSYAPLWAEDGRSVTLTYAVPGYTLEVAAPDAPPTVYEPSGLRELWLITMVYAPEDDRWKIAEARLEPQL
jgi:hypothetical protein